MNNLFTDIEIIDKYLKGAGTEHEKQIVEKRLGSDAKFRQLFDEMELMIAGIKETAMHTSKEEKLEHLRNFYNEAYNDTGKITSSEIDDVIKDMGSSSEDYEAPTPGSGLGKGKVISFPAADVISRFKVAIAAAVTLLIAAWFVVFQMNPVTNQELFADYFEPFNNMGGNTRSNDPTLDLQRQAYAAYDEEDYEKSALLFEELISADDQLLDIFYLGNAYLAINEAEKAIEKFKVLENAEMGLGLKAKWYLALGYLFLDDVDQARIKLQEVMASDDEHSMDAQKILKKLE